jgi:hypothetical protein
MSRRPDAPTPADDPVLDDADAHGAAVAPDLSNLPIAGITRRRMAGVVAFVLAAWVIIVFARQVSAAAAASTRATDIAAANVAMSRQVAALDRELDLIGRSRYVQQQARGYGLGGSDEIAFTLAPDAPPLAADAPGSAAVRLGADHHDPSPLDRWLTVLFGPAD